MKRIFRDSPRVKAALLLALFLALFLAFVVLRSSSGKNSSSSWSAGVESAFATLAAETKTIARLPHDQINAEPYVKNFYLSPSSLRGLSAEESQALQMRAVEAIQTFQSASNVMVGGEAGFWFDPATDQLTIVVPRRSVQSVVTFLRALGFPVPLSRTPAPMPERPPAA